MRSQNRFEANERKVYQTRMLKLCPNQYSSVYGQLRMALLDLGQSQKAIIYIKKAISIRPQRSEITLSLAKALWNLQKDNECFSCLKEALSFSPTSWDLHSFLIKTLEQQDKFEEIESFYQDIVNQLTDPKDLPLFYYESALVLEHYNKYSHALRSFKKVIESGIQQDHYFHYQYAMALHHEGEFEEAIVQFEHTWRLSPDDKLARNQIAYLHYCLGRVKKALEGLEKIVENGLGMYATYSHFLLILYHLDEDEKVIDKYKSLVKPYIRTDSLKLRNLYKEEVRLTERILDRNDIDEETRRFNEKKLEGLEMALSLIN